MTVNPAIRYYTSTFSGLSTVTITHGLGYRPQVELLIDDGSIDYEYIKGIAKTTITTEQIIVDFGNYNLSGRIVYS